MSCQILIASSIWTTRRGKDQKPEMESPHGNTCLLSCLRQLSDESTSTTSFIQHGWAPKECCAEQEASFEKKNPEPDDDTEEIEKFLQTLKEEIEKQPRPLQDVSPIERLLGRLMGTDSCLPCHGLSKLWMVLFADQRQIEACPAIKSPLRRKPSTVQVRGFPNVSVTLVSSFHSSQRATPCN